MTRWEVSDSSPHSPRRKRGCLRLPLGFTGERRCLLDGEGHGLAPPHRELSPAVREIALRGPAPRAKPVEPHPTLGALFPRIQSGVEGAPIP